MRTPPSQILLRSDLSAQIRDALQLRDWERMEHWARQWIQIEPKNPEGFLWLARASLAQNKVQRAAYAYGRILDFDANHVEARRFFARYPSSVEAQGEGVRKKLQRKSGEHAPAAEGLLSPSERNALARAELSLAESYEQLKIYAEAAEAFRRSQHWEPTQAAVLGRARNLHRQMRSLDALRLLQQEVNAHPRFVEGRILLGTILSDLGRRSEAQREWQRVLEEEPQNALALKKLQQLFSGLG